MILFKYSKQDGAEYISHLDMLKNLGRTFRRMQISVKYSQGFHPHLLVYMSAPLGVGIQSVSEYCLVDTDEDAESFKAKFNEWSQKGIKCLYAHKTDEKVKVASDIYNAEYLIKGEFNFDEKEILNSSEFILTDKNGFQKNVKDQIYSIEKVSDGLKVVIGFARGLRIERFIEKLQSIYGEKIKTGEIIKLKGLTKDGLLFEEICR